MRRDRGRNRGQAMVEFALIGPLFFLLILGITDMARAVFYYNVISNASREGAREAVLAYNQCANNNGGGTWCAGAPPAGTTVIGVNNAINRAGAGAVAFTKSGGTTGFVDTGTTNTATAPSCTPAPNAGCAWVFLVNGTLLNSCTGPAGAPPGDEAAWSNCNFNSSKEGGNHDVVVEIEFNFQPLTPFVGAALGNATLMWAKSEMRTEY